MKLLFRIVKSSFTDKLAYVSAVVSALCWLIHAWYPAMFSRSVKGNGAYLCDDLGLSGGGNDDCKNMFLWKAILRSMQELISWRKRRLPPLYRDSKWPCWKIREESNRISERESILKSKLKNFENSETEAQLSSLRKKIRLGEEDRKTCLVSCS